MAKKIKKKYRARRFYRSNLSTIVWDPVLNKSIADFTPGHFTTKDETIAEMLVEMGYVEIPLDATEPPADVIVNQPTFDLKGDVPVINNLSGRSTPSPAMEAMVEDKMKLATEQAGGPPVEETPKVPKVKKPAKKSSGTSIKKKIARRKKDD